MLQRRLNLIVYQPGLCGHFLQYLLGLDPSVYSLCGGLDRREFYSFHNVLAHYGSWYHHHQYHSQRFGRGYQHVAQWLDSDHPLAVIAVHPFTLMTRIDLTRLGTVDVCYYTVTATDELRVQCADQFFASSVFDSTGHLPFPSSQQLAQEQQYYQQSLLLSPMQYISLDSIVSQTSFYTEYLRLCSLMTVSALDRTVIEEFYLGWRSQRFQGLSI